MYNSFRDPPGCCSRRRDVQTDEDTPANVRAHSVCTTKDNNILRKTNCQVNIYTNNEWQRARLCACVTDDTHGAPLSIRRNLLRLALARACPQWPTVADGS